MAVLAATCGPAVLALYPRRFDTLLQETRLIDDQDAVRTTELFNDIRPQIVADRIRIPVRSIEQALHALRPRLAEMFGELPAILPLHAIQQPGQIPLRALARFRPPETWGNPGMQVVKPCPPAPDLFARRHDILPLREMRGYCTYRSTVAVVLILQRHFRMRGRLRQYERGRMSAVYDEQGSMDTEVSL